MLASFLVTGLSPQPSFDDYFNISSEGILGNRWMQSHFSQHAWHSLHSAIHIDPNPLMNLVRQNAQSAWMLHQRLVIDEMIIPFTGRWQYIQHVKNKPHNTGKYVYIDDNIINDNINLFLQV